MQQVRVQEIEYRGQGNRRKPAFQPIDPFAPRRQRTLPANNVKDVDGIALPPLKYPYQPSIMPPTDQQPPRRLPIHSAPPRYINILQQPSFTPITAHHSPPHTYPILQPLPETPNLPPSAQWGVPIAPPPTQQPIPTQGPDLQSSFVPLTRTWEGARLPSPTLHPLPAQRPDTQSNPNGFSVPPRHWSMHEPQTWNMEGPPSPEFSGKNLSIVSNPVTNGETSNSLNSHKSVEVSLSSQSSLQLDRFLLTDLLRDTYLLLLLNIPRLYFSRVERVLKEAHLTIEEMMEMSLVSSPAYMKLREDIMERGSYNPNVKFLTPAYERLRTAWELFINGLLQDWKVLNVITVLLLSTIISIFQIERAANDPLTRYTAFGSLICALMSLMYSCVFLTRFASMRQPYKAVEWAVEAQKMQATLWNVWVMLATPVVWLSWSIIAFISSIMSFMWRVGAKSSDHETSIAPEIELIFRVLLTFLLLLGIIYGVLIINTLRRYGSRMDEAWEHRIDECISKISPNEGEEQNHLPPTTVSTPTRTLSRSSSAVTSIPPAQFDPSAAIPSPIVGTCKSNDETDNPSHFREVRLDVADSGDATGTAWYPPPHPHSQTPISGDMGLALRSSDGRGRRSHPYEIWLTEPFHSRDKADIFQPPSVPPRTTSGSPFSPDHEGAEVVIGTQPRINDLTSPKYIPRFSDELHHQAFYRGKERGRSRSPALDYANSPPLSKSVNGASKKYDMAEFTSNTSSTQEQEREVDQTAVGVEPPIRGLPPRVLSPSSVPIPELPMKES